MTITMPGRFTLGAVVAVLALVGLFLAVVATSTGAVQGNEQQCEYDVILLEQVCTSSDGETTLSNTSTPTPEPTEEVGFARWMPVPDVLHDGTLRPTKVASVIPPIPPIKDFTYTISTATPKPRVRMLRQVRDVQVHNNQGAQGQGAQAQQTTPTSNTLVSNTGKSDASNLNLDQDYAQAFQTGTNSHGYRLTSVQIEFDAGGSPPVGSYRVQIVNDSNFKPGNKIDQLNPPSSLRTGLNTFAAAGSGVDLQPETYYYIVFDLDQAHNAVKLKATLSNDEDSGNAAGWKITDDFQYRSLSGGTWTIPLNDEGSLKIVVKGYAKTPPALTSQVVTGTKLVLTFDQNLDTSSRPAAGQFGIRFGGGALQRATAISISGKEVTLTVPEVRAGQVVTVS